MPSICGVLSWCLIILALPASYLVKIAANLVPADQEIILWIPLQDYKRGHILLYEDKLIDEYTAGKAYIFPKKEHAVANMSYEPKLSIVMMVVKNED